MHSDLRGGSWDSNPGDCRSAFRDLNQPVYANGNVGFRVVCLPGEVAPPRMLLRGGSWVNDPRLCRSAWGGHALPGNASLNSGFRVVCLPGEVTP